MQNRSLNHGEPTGHQAFNTVMEGQLPRVPEGEHPGAVNTESGESSGSAGGRYHRTSPRRQVLQT